MNRLRVFCYGGLFSMTILAIIQDYMGKEKYLQWVSDHWTAMPWWVWTLPMLSALVALIYDRGGGNGQR